MVRGLYTSAAGMLVQWTNQDMLSNNLANLNTAGFKKDISLVKSLPKMIISRENDIYFKFKDKNIDLRPIIGIIGTGAQIEEVFTVHSQGQIRQTDNVLDFAISGEGFFTVQTPQGTRYTRNGAFSLNTNQELVQENGYLVLGRNGPIKITGKGVVIDEGGRVFVDGNYVDTLQISNFGDLRSLQKVGDNLFSNPTGAGVNVATNFQIKQGYLEMSNVNVVREMVDMIQVMRTYEANQKLIQSQDHTLDRVINEVGRAV